MISIQGKHTILEGEARNNHIQILQEVNLINLT